ncbi:translation factor (SUA5) [Levilactobacillus namurensis DSM 19117]|uniref:Threonylcarbamoyl-AMP synthase n=1 Tax=Levilactobacillus namurensis DSM 19117 TaxID=1423773 RepID=A0A0R1KAB8_9LACO|nr:L-threonylcarbamoyladenylate synthase [Levilactobacillus namurensis]KRK76730.1 translation factor (SUA5) [Levilactobacillus namurensis DSM 19117]GEO73814.1 threonylcarbamoyl-AMP synthase [Levilactobacillus namurensis]HJE45355.1 threonylcarbamoyl-AMP synthase [Levilactobacillus namurensis]
METQIFQPNQVEAAAALLKAGQLVAFPTETVYGLGADATNETAVKKVYAAKGRPSDNPLIVTVTGQAMVEEYAQPLSATAQKLMQAFWPGSLTLILNLQPGALSKAVTGGLRTAAFRNPKNKTTLNLIQAAGVPIVGPSANTSGKPSPTLAQHVYHDLNGKIAGIVDDGPAAVGVESTILDLTADVPTILRPGAVTEEQLAAVIGTVRSNHHKVGATEVPKAPGMKYKHYAPDAQVYIVDQVADWPAALQWAAQQTTPVGVMAVDSVLADQTLPANAEVFSLGTDIASASHLLFDGLRHFDLESPVKNILTQGFPPVGLGAAYMNRLNKSAGQMHFSK